MDRIEKVFFESLSMEEIDLVKNIIKQKREEDKKAKTARFLFEDLLNSIRGLQNLGYKISYGDCEDIDIDGLDYYS